MMIKKFIAFGAVLKIILLFLLGSFFESINKEAANKNNNPTILYNEYRFLSSMGLNNNKPKIMGPITVPNELIPPAKFNLWEPFFILPRFITNGFAAVCWIEKPRPTTNNANSIREKEFLVGSPLTANIIIFAPIAERIKPYIILYL